ncbi:MAG TPA: Spy/CpxP family protein refolding chaperone [Pyrinomonadaceae bacterium]
MKLTGSKKIIMGGALAVALTLTAIGLAQQPTTQGQGGQERAGRQWGRGGGDHRGMKGGFGVRFAEKLNLTDAQKEQMKQIAARYRESARAERQQRRGAGRAGRRSEFGIFNGGTFDENAVRAAAQARANAQVEREVARARMMYEMYNVLTAEQKSQLQAERQQWEQKRQERRARRGAKRVQSN